METSLEVPRSSKPLCKPYEPHSIGLQYQPPKTFRRRTLASKFKQLPIWFSTKRSKTFFKENLSLNLYRSSSHRSSLSIGSRALCRRLTRTVKGREWREFLIGCSLRAPFIERSSIERYTQKSAPRYYTLCSTQCVVHKIGRWHIANNLSLRSTISTLH